MGGSSRRRGVVPGQDGSGRTSPSHDRGVSLGRSCRASKLG
ncbi:hypothetical protein Rumeso_01654 [Rubellimicrobium mesophilum DSM 19309]|uniref:Uncharacterized protein n=1 Tax=Rubellimicrobium mesophilum DSM 19309 TaxID=442562 RepID=A0A017HQN6_9RHOB|nr:hypothetical protein Rumeso_01654 [Rubellimicrobium mesophilum DSM 19309]